jgi:HlyD family secretion protein
MSNPWVKRIGILLAVVIVAAVGWRFVGHDKTAKVSYELADVDRGTVEKSISSTGSVAALVTVDVGSQISGQISELKADFNTQVKKGDLLAVIDPQTRTAATWSARGNWPRAS